jgi:carbamoyl-phosphate synthase small subunit
MYNWREKRERKAFLALENGEIFKGYSVGAPVDKAGEVIFNTNMFGHEEIVTNPAYAGQLVTLTTPEVGNCGTNPDDMESGGLFLSGLIVHELNQASNFRSEIALEEMLKKSDIPMLAGVDTRRLTLTLRNCGTQKGWLHCDGTDLSPEEAVKKAKSLTDKVYSVGTDIPYTYNENGSCPVVALDFGITSTELSLMEAADMKVTVLPAQTTAEEILKYEPKGLYLSGGSEDSFIDIREILKLMDKLPVMGVGAGYQTICLALGAMLENLKFGHHGANHPVKNLLTGRTEITTQNHNFAVLADSLPAELELTHISLNDNTAEGVRHKTRPVFGIQYNPATPSIFEEFKAAMGR